MMSASEIRREGFRALCDRLGMAGALRFMEQFESGSGDYTRERPAILGRRRVRDVVKDILKRRRKG